jgi:HSP20 family protein
MANVIRRDGGEPSMTRPTEWDPFRIMRDLMRFEPLDRNPMFNPQFDVKETPEAFEFRGDLPGVKEVDVQVQLTGNRLTISGKREAEEEHKGDTWYTCERTYGAFTRSFTMPEGIEGERIVAEMKDGVLTLVVPKRPEVQPRTIPVKPGKPAEKKS